MHHQHTSVVHHHDTQEHRIVSDNRPTLITVLCGFAFVQWVITSVSLILFAIITPADQVLTLKGAFTQLSISTLGIILTASPFLIGALMIGSVIGIVGIWLQYRFAVIVYGATVIATFVLVHSQISLWNEQVLYTILMTALYPVTVLVTAGYYFKRMR